MALMEESGSGLPMYDDSQHVSVTDPPSAVSRDIPVFSAGIPVLGVGGVIMVWGRVWSGFPMQLESFVSHVSNTGEMLTEPLQFGGETTLPLDGDASEMLLGGAVVAVNVSDEAWTRQYSIVRLIYGAEGIEVSDSFPVETVSLGDMGGLPRARIAYSEMLDLFALAFTTEGKIHLWAAARNGEPIPDSLRIIESPDGTTRYVNPRHRLELRREPGDGLESRHHRAVARGGGRSAFQRLLGLTPR